MQYITIGVARTRDMLGIDVRVQLRGVDGTPGSRQRAIRSLRYRFPVSLTTEQAYELAEAVADHTRDILAAPPLPF